MSNTKQELKAVLEGNAKFTKDLYKILSGGSTNVFFSPISAHSALSMVYQGAHGHTKEAFSVSLHVPEAAVAAEGYYSVISLLNDMPDVQLHIANKVYINEEYKLLSSFKEIAQEKFFSEVDQINFTNNVQAADAINCWVERKTNNKIKDLISSDSVNSLTRVVLVNAIYFKAAWLDKFNPRSTRTETFYLNDNDTVECQMMFRNNEYMFKDDKALDATVLRMPYRNRDFSLIIVLPNERNGIHDLEAELSKIDLTKITEGMRHRDVRVTLPKFKIETTINLTDVLSKMGLGIIFNPAKADFTGMIDGPEPLYVSEVIQKAFIEVNEEGAEAAAATRCETRTMCYTPPVDFTADHPFIVALCVRQHDTLNILFKGRISNPLL